MSQLREFKLKIDLSVMEDTLRDLEYIIKKDSEVVGYATRGLKAPLVAIGKEADIGFTEDKLIYDDMTQKDVERIMPAYYENLIKEKITNRGLQVVKKVTPLSIVYVVKK